VEARPTDTQGHTWTEGGRKERDWSTTAKTPAAAEAKQWSEWGFDDLKVRWNPRSAPGSFQREFISKGQDVQALLNAPRGIHLQLVQTA